MKTKNLVATLIGITSLCCGSTLAAPPSGGGNMPQSTSAVMVVDKNGKVLGRYSSPLLEGGYHIMFVPFNGYAVALPIFWEGLSTTDGSSFYYSDYFLRVKTKRAVVFTNTSCTGQAYVYGTLPGVRQGVLVKTVDRTTLYLANAPKIDSPLTIYSYISLDTCVNETPFSLQGLSPATAIDVTGQFEEPFHLQ